MSKCAGYTMLSAPQASQVSQRTGYCLNFLNAQALRSSKLRYSIQGFNAKGGRPGMQSMITCGTPALGDNHGYQNVKSSVATISHSIFSPVKSYPWDKLTTKLMLHFADAVWFVGKWLAVPSLILVALRDVLFTVSVGKELVIPIGLLVGTIFTGIVKETLLKLDIDFQHSVLPWHLVVLGLLFVLLRFHAAVGQAPAFQAFFAIGGLWQTIRFALDWKARKEEPKNS